MCSTPGLVFVRCFCQLFNKTSFFTS